MRTIVDLYKNNNLFKAGFLIGSGFTLIICGSVIVMSGTLNMIKYGFQK